MDISSSQNSAFSIEEDKQKYIKKNIAPIRRNPSAIFGDPVSQQNGFMDLPSPRTSQHNSRVNKEIEDKSKQERPREENEEVGEIYEAVQIENKQEEDEKVQHKSEEQGMAVIEDKQSLNDSELSPINIDEAKQRQINSRNKEQKRQDVMLDNRASDNPPPRSTFSSHQNQQSEPKKSNQPQKPNQQSQQYKQYRQNKSNQMERPSQPNQQIKPNQSNQPQNHQSKQNKSNVALKLILQSLQLKPNAEEDQPPIMGDLFTESKVQKLRLKHNRLHLIQHSPDHTKLILEILSRNTHHLQSIQERINSQSVILNQFKEETSRKLEENVKLALKEKMGEINRENSKEIRDIKNICVIMQELFLQNSKRMDTLERKVDMLLANASHNTNAQK